MKGRPAIPTLMIMGSDTRRWSPVGAVVAGPDGAPALCASKERPAQHKGAIAIRAVQCLAALHEPLGGAGDALKRHRATGRQYRKPTMCQTWHLSSGLVEEGAVLIVQAAVLDAAPVQVVLGHGDLVARTAAAS